MAMNRITVRAPATTANLGPGFDCLGMALDLWAEVVVSAAEEPMPPPSDPIGSLAVEAARRLFSHVGTKPPSGLSAECTRPIPVARGLGASAVARAAGLLAANSLLGEPLDREEMLALGAELEGHADNMAPTLFGGLQVAVRDGESVAHVGLTVPAGLKAVLFVPDQEMPTQESRQVLPQQLSRQDAIYNIGRAALLVAALASGRLDLLDVATQDRLHQPARAKIFPAMQAIFQAAREAGALGAFLSGGGSTILALACQGEESIGRAMAEAAAREGVGGETMITAPSDAAAQIVGKG
ncbi:MAG: homoserine kinase [Chloroflexota bacterium]|nr:homoserine kinase [Chloroflexota bacterium]